MKSPDSLILAFGPFFADPLRRTLTHQRDGVLPLTPKQFDTLLFLAEHSGEVLDKDTILGHVWAGTIVEENNLSQAISQLRKVLGDDGETHRYILTVPRKGYRFVASVARVSEAPEAAREPDAAVPAEAAPPTPPPPSTSPAPLPLTAPPAPPTAITLPSTLRRFPTRIHLAVGALVLLAAAALGFALKNSTGGGSATAGAEKSVAVLQFTNLSADKEDEYFSAGMTEDMLTQLAQVSGLRVVSYSAPAEKTKADRTLAKQLGVQHMLQGTVRRAANRFRISAQLVDAETGRHLWAKSYDREIKDILIVQSEVATEIAEALRAVLLPGEREILARHADGNPELHLLYKQGMYLITNGNRFTDDAERGVKLLERILAIDPASPLGHAGLAAYQMRQPNLRRATSADAFAKAEAHVQRALESDPLSAEAHTINAEILARAHWRWKEAGQSSAKGVALNPGSAHAWSIHAKFGLLPNGRTGEGLIAARKALALEPLNPDARQTVVTALEMLERFDEAIAEAKLNLEIYPSYRAGKITLHILLERNGQFPETVLVARQLKLPWLPPEALDELDAAFRAGGAKDYWRARLKWAQRWDKQDSQGKFHLAAVATQVGDVDLAFAALDRAIEGRNIYLPMLKVDPWFKPLRADPRWAVAMQRMGFD